MSKARVLLVFIVLMGCLAVAPAHAASGDAKTLLRGFEEVPAIAAPGNAHFIANIGPGDVIQYTLSYTPLSTPITQSHIHFSTRGVNGGIVVFLCSNLGNGPAGTQACPAAPATITGTITANNVLGVPAQGFQPGSFAELVQAIQAGAAYVNIHTTAFPGGEVRGQLVFTPTP